MLRRVALGAAMSLVFIALILFEPHFRDLFAGRESFTQALFGHPRLDYRHLWDAVRQARWEYLAATFLLNPVHVLVRAHRWRLMVKPLGRLKMVDSFSLQMAGYAANAVLPLRAGEVARGVMLGRRIGVSRVSSLATVLTERLLDTVSLLTLVAAVSWFYEFPPLVHGAEVWFGVVAGLMLAGAAYLTFAPAPQDGGLGKALKVVPGAAGRTLRHLVEKFTVGFVFPRSLPVVAVILLETAALWLIYAYQGYLLMVGFGFTRDYPLVAASPALAALVLLVMNAIGTSVPSAPGAVGTFHALCILGLSLFDIPPDPAAGFALVIHALVMGYYLLGGLPCVWREGLRLRELLGSAAAGSDR